MLASPTTALHGSPLESLFHSSCPTISLSSCSQEALLSTFDWSDFPIVGDVYSGPITTTQQPMRYNHRDIVPQCPIRTTGLSTPGMIPKTKKRINESSSTHASTTTTLLKRATTISFADRIQVRTYNVTLGDHPACQGGMALQLDWEYTQETRSLERYEAESLKRQPQAMRLGYVERRNRLMECSGWTGPQLLQQEYKRIMGVSDIYALHHTPSVQRALMAAAGMEE